MLKTTSFVPHFLPTWQWKPATDDHSFHIWSRLLIIVTGLPTSPLDFIIMYHRLLRRVSSRNTYIDREVTKGQAEVQLSVPSNPELQRQRESVCVRLRVAHRQQEHHSTEAHRQLGMHTLRSLLLNWFWTHWGCNKDQPWQNKLSFIRAAKARRVKPKWRFILSY